MFVEREVLGGGGEGGGQAALTVAAQAAATPSWAVIVCSIASTQKGAVTNFSSCGIWGRR